MYNLTPMTNASNFMVFAQGTNAILGGYFFGYFILIVAFLITFIALKSKGYYTSACFSVGCWLAMLCALLLRPMGLIDNYGFWFAVLLVPVSVFILFLSGTSD